LLSIFLDVDAFFNLEIREAWKVFLRNSNQVRGTKDSLLDFSVVFSLHKPIDVLFKSENFLTDLILSKTYDIFKRVCFFLFRCILVDIRLI
jgi:hypothetical protein